PAFSTKKFSDHPGSVLAVHLTMPQVLQHLLIREPSVRQSIRQDAQVSGVFRFLVVTSKPDDVRLLLPIITSRELTWRHGVVDSRVDELIVGRSKAQFTRTGTSGIIK